MLGWKITKEGEYSIKLPSLSKEEEDIVSLLEGKFLESVRSAKAHGPEDIKKTIVNILDGHAKANGFYLERDQRNYLGTIAHMHIYGAAFLEPLLEDPSIEEISIIGINKPAYVYIRDKGWLSVNAQFTSEAALAETINKISQTHGRRITLQNPKLNASLLDGSRLHATLHPISEGEITIRKFKERPFSMPELAKNQTLNANLAAFLWLVMQSDSSVLVCGNTASGKTTLLNALFAYVPANERIVITEETPEINVLHTHQVRLVANKEMGISLLDLLHDSLRMRPDRLIIGEVRTPEETHALFDALLAGQARGCYATFHAQSVEEAKKRIAHTGIPKEDISSINCIIIQRRILRYDPKTKTNTELRRLVEIECFGEPVAAYDITTGRYESDIPNYVYEMLGKKLGLTPIEVKKEHEKRHAFLEKAPENHTEFFSGLQKKWYGVT